MNAKEPLVWASRTIALKDLKPYENNPRRMTKVAFENLKRSLKELGIKEVEVLVPSRELTAEEFDRINIRDNLPFGDFDFDILGNRFDPEQLKGWGMPAEWLPETDGVVNVAAGDVEDAPAAPAKPKTVKGDLYEIGTHRLLCGDSCSPTALEKLLGGKKVEMVFTDPPYRMEAQGGSNQPIGKAAAKLGKKIKELCDFDPIGFLNVLPTVFENGKMNSYVFCNKDLVPDYLKWCVDAGYSFNILFWKKPNAIPLGGQHRPDVEYLLVFRKSAHWNNAIDGVNYSKCLEYGRENSTPHPTMKPVELVANELQISSSVGGLVLDLFGGSGTTMVAAHQHGRRSALMELDPAYCDVIVGRMAALYPDLPIKRNGKPIKWK